MIYQAPPYKPSEFALARRHRRWGYLVGCLLAILAWGSLALAVAVAGGCAP